MLGGSIPAYVWRSSAPRRERWCGRKGTRRTSAEKAAWR